MKASVRALLVAKTIMEPAERERSVTGEANASDKFTLPDRKPMGIATEITQERLFTLKEVAADLRMSTQSARLIVKMEPGVLKKKGPTGQRTRYYIPESVLRRIRNRMVA